MPERCTTEAIALLQARTGSKRLPGKALLEVSGRPLLWYVVQALKNSPAVGTIVLATSDTQADDRLTELAASWGIESFRGSENDVLSRMAGAARRFPAPYYFRATGDNPLIDTENPRRTLRRLIENALDYCAEKGLPHGAIVEAFTAEALQRADQEAFSAADREHVTTYIKQSPAFSKAFPQAPAELRFPSLSLSVDTAEDFSRVASILLELYREKPPTFREVLKHQLEKRPPAKDNCQAKLEMS